MEKDVREQDLALLSSNIFHTNPIDFPKVQTVFYNARGLKTSQFCYFRCALSISGILQVIDHNMRNFLGKMWSRDHSCKGPIVFSILVILSKYFFSSRGT